MSIVITHPQLFLLLFVYRYKMNNYTCGIWKFKSVNKAYYILKMRRLIDKRMNLLIRTYHVYNWNVCFIHYIYNVHKCIFNHLSIHICICVDKCIYMHMYVYMYIYWSVYQWKLQSQIHFNFLIISK